MLQILQVQFQRAPPIWRKSTPPLSFMKSRLKKNFQESQPPSQAGRCSRLSIRNSSVPVGKREIAREFHLHGDDRIALKALLRSWKATAPSSGDRARRLGLLQRHCQPSACLRWSRSILTAKCWPGRSPGRRKSLRRRSSCSRSGVGTLPCCPVTASWLSFTGRMTVSIRPDRREFDQDRRGPGHLRDDA